MQLQSALRLIYPDQCVSCGALVDGPDGLCASCWSATPFISGLVCDTCGVPLLGETDGQRPLCDDCMDYLRPWDRGRAAMTYSDNSRRMVLALKHGDRLDLARPAARWMAPKLEPMICPETLLVPVPIHWTRLIRRRFNQAAVLARELGRISGVEVLPDGLVRTRSTAPQERMTRTERTANQAGAIAPHPRRGALLSRRPVVLIDDVMTSGATLAAAAGAALKAGAIRVDMVVLTRVAKV